MWQSCCPSDFNSVWARSPCHLWKGPLKQDLLDIYLTTFFGVSKSENTSAMRVIFFRKCSKWNLNLENVKKHSQNIFGFWDNIPKIFLVFEIISSENVAIKLSLLRRQYLLSAVNGLTNSPKILNITQRDFFNRNYLHRDQ